MEVQNIHIIDLDFMGESHAIATYLIESTDGLILIESGPETTFENLKDKIASLEYDWKDVRHVLLTHIHFDHAGAAWKFAQNGAKIYVHPIGLPHLQNPEKLWNSAKMIYQDQMEILWGEMQPIQQEQLIPLDDGDCIQIGEHKITTHYTPGHAIHHNAYQFDDIIFTGDVAGCKINQGPVVPPCPPPDIHIENWITSIDKLKKLQPKYIVPTHFGIIENPQKHLDELAIILEDWANWMKPYFEQATPAEEIIPLFIQYTDQQLLKNGASEEDVKRYARANPSWMSVNGLLRYWKLKSQGRI